MDREESRLRRSPFVLRDTELTQYVQDLACRIAGDHCADIRVSLVRTAQFNANMAPNGMMQVWTGLLLRIENEAQLAAILGHEIGHYLARHSLERLRSIKSSTAVGQFMGLFGIVGAIGQLALVAGMFAYTREQEREADRIGLALMRKAGYEPLEAPKVWSNLLLEINAKPERDPARNSVVFATHPSPEDRQNELKRLAEAAPGGRTNSGVWESRVGPHRRAWLAEEIRRGQHEESIALLTRMMTQTTRQPDVAYARGEVYRLRGQERDFDAAIADFQAAVAMGSEPPETHRGMGLIYRARNQLPEAKASFQRYLETAPDAPDSPMIKSYMEVFGT
jgi:predicted Zn-dependent protease